MFKLEESPIKAKLTQDPKTDPDDYNGWISRIFEHVRESKGL